MIENALEDTSNIQPIKWRSSPRGEENSRQKLGRVHRMTRQTSNQSNDAADDTSNIQLIKWRSSPKGGKKIPPKTKTCA